MGVFLNYDSAGGARGDAGTTAIPVEGAAGLAERDGRELIQGEWSASSAFHPETKVFDAAAANRGRMVPFEFKE